MATLGLMLALLSACLLFPTQGSLIPADITQPPNVIERSMVEDSRADLKALALASLQKRGSGTYQRDESIILNRSWQNELIWNSYVTWFLSCSPGLRGPRLMTAQKSTQRRQRRPSRRRDQSHSAMYLMLCQRSRDCGAHDQRQQEHQPDRPGHH